MTATTTTTAPVAPPELDLSDGAALYSNRRRWTAPFPCGDCKGLTRPPKTLKDAPGMEDTLSYGGRGRCSPCYSQMDGKRPYERTAQVRREPTPIQMDYMLTTLGSFMQRRQQRLNSGSTARIVRPVRQLDRATA